MASLFDKLVGSVLKTVTMVLCRGLTHLVALVCSVFFVDAALGTGPLDEIFLKLSVYAGLICLVPWGTVSNPYWFVPVGAGLLQGLALLVLGIPWPLMLFWAGLATWLSRLVIARGSIGWDWTAVPILVVGLFTWLSTASLWGMPLWPLVSLPVIVLAALVVYRAWLKVCHKSVHRQILASVLVRMRALVQQGKISGPELGYLKVLLSQCEKLAVLGALDETAVDRVNNVTTRLENQARTNSGKPLNGLFKSAQWQHFTYSASQNSQVKDLLAELRSLVIDLGKLLGPEDRAGGSISKLAEISASAALLLQKAGTCPAELIPSLETIAFLAMDMVKCMEQDPNDVRDGTSFLNRYLPRVHHIADEVARMPKNLPLERTKEVLDRLVSAFKEERARMDRNDNISYTAEIDALDNLLKMRGY